MGGHSRCAAQLDFDLALGNVQREAYPALGNGWLLFDMAIHRQGDGWVRWCVAGSSRTHTHTHPHGYTHTHRHTHAHTHTHTRTWKRTHKNA